MIWLPSRPPVPGPQYRVYRLKCRLAAQVTALRREKDDSCRPRDGLNILPLRCAYEWWPDEGWPWEAGGEWSEGGEWAEPPEQEGEPAPAEEDIVPAKMKMSRKKAPTSEAGLAQTRLVANLIDGVREIRDAQRAQQKEDQRLAIEDQAARASTRTETRPEKSAQLSLTDKRGRSSSRTAARDRDETPEFPVEGTETVSDISHKKAKRTPQEIMRKHHQQNRDHLRPRKTITLPIAKRKPKNIVNFGNFLFSDFTQFWVNFLFSDFTNLTIKIYRKFPILYISCEG